MGKSNKLIKLVIIILVFLLGSCSEKTEESTNSTGKVERYLKIVDNRHNPIQTRLIFNKKAFEILKGRVNDSINNERILNSAQNFYYLNEHELFYKSLKIVEKKSIILGDSLTLGKVKWCIGIYFEEKFLLDSSYKYFNKAKTIFFKIKSNYNLAKINLAIASLQFDVNDFINSEKSIFNALKILKKDNESKDFDFYVSYNLLGNIYCQSYDFDKALEYQNKALEVLDDEDITATGFQYKAFSINNIGNIYKNKNDFRKAENYFSKTLVFNNLKVDFPFLYATAKDNLGYCNLKTGNLKIAFELFSEAYKIRDSLNLVKGSITSKLHLSEFYCQTNDTPKAKEFAYSAYKLSKANKLSSETLMSLQQLINCNENIKASSQQYIKLNDSLQIAERKIRNKFARIAYETDEIVLQKDTAVKHKWIILIVAGSILLLLILLFIIKIQRAKQKELMFIQQQQEVNENIYRLIQDQQIKINEARHLEKKRISQELHDGVMNKLTSTRLNLFILSKKRDDETINKCLGFINDIQNIEKEIRQVSHDLNSDIFSGNNSFSTLLESLFNQQRAISNANLFTEIDTSIPWETMESVIKMNLYRILQEAFQNCNKYAQATNIYVTISTGVGTLQIIINDDGLGFNDKKYRKGIGLKNMKDRVDAIFGQIDILSQKRKGTTIIVNLPIK